MIKYIYLFLLLPILTFSETIDIDLIDPTSEAGRIFTEHGGIITTDKMRVQAEKIEYQDIDENKLLTAANHLLLVYEKKFFIGDNFTYNFTTKTGVIENGVANVDGMFIGGEKIVFHPDGNIEVFNQFASTSDNKESDWSFKSEKLTMDKQTAFKASSVTLNAYNTPVFYLPSFSMTAKKKLRKEPKALYRAYWIKGQGPLFLMRYRILDHAGLKLYVRGEYRIPKGPGGAIELDYISPEKNQTLQMRNYYTYDTFYNDNNPHKYKSRYRIQGIYKGKSSDRKLEGFARWDVLSDKNMRADFPTKLFELQTLERTEAFAKARYDQAFTSIYARPRVNTYRGFKQEFPTLKIAFKPYNIKDTGIIFQNYLNFSYLDYVYADNLQGKIPDFHSARFQTNQTLYRPFNFSCFHITPQVGFKGIFYSNNPKNNSVLQTLFHYDIDSHMAMEKTYTTLTHEIKPYLNFKGISSPEAQIGRVYIFSLQDGFNLLNQVKIGCKNYFYKEANKRLNPRFETDLFAYSFVNASTFNKTFPKAGLDLKWQYPKLKFGTHLGWNIEKNTWDYNNFYLGWTLNEYFAFSTELRHRGHFYWRKNNQENNILDVTHSIFELANSPLSDERTVFLTRWEMQLAPFWTLKVLNYVGWRTAQPFYHESQFKLSTIVSNKVCLKFSYTRKVNNNIFTFGANLL